MNRTVTFVYRCSDLDSVPPCIVVRDRRVLLEITSHYHCKYARGSGTYSGASCIRCRGQTLSPQQQQVPWRVSTQTDGDYFQHVTSAFFTLISKTQHTTTLLFSGLVMRFCALKCWIFFLRTERLLHCTFRRTYRYIFLIKIVDIIL